VTTELTTPPKLLVFGDWSTAIYRRDLAAEDPATVAEKNAELRALILEGEEREAGHSFAMIGPSKKASLDILRWEHPAVDWLRERIREAINDMLRAAVGPEAEQLIPRFSLSIEGWSVTYREGASHRQHVHHGSAWSGVYYIETGGVGQDAGFLQLLDPRPGAVARQASSGPLLIKPQPGLMVGFPSWAPHSVRATKPAEGQLRICVAWNAAYNEEGVAA
jgi:uncharacterized protein (TIGR02466 family)